MNWDGKIIVLAWYRAQDYAAHRRLDPKGMEPRFKDWLKNAEYTEKRLKADGFTVHRVMLDPAQLAGWAALNGGNIDTEMRARFAHHLFGIRQSH